MLVVAPLVLVHLINDNMYVVHTSKVDWLLIRQTDLQLVTLYLGYQRTSFLIHWVERSVHLLFVQ